MASGSPCRASHAIVYCEYGRTSTFVTVFQPDDAEVRGFRRRRSLDLNRDHHVIRLVGLPRADLLRRRAGEQLVRELVVEAAIGKTRSQPNRRGEHQHSVVIDEVGKPHREHAIAAGLGGPFVDRPSAESCARQLGTCASIQAVTSPMTCSLPTSLSRSWK